MGEGGRRVHAHPMNLFLEESFCLWLFGSVLTHKMWPVGFMAQQITGDLAMTSYGAA